MTQAAEQQSESGQKSGSAEGSIAYAERVGAYGQAEALDNLVEDRPPETAEAAPEAEEAEAEGSEGEAAARPGYDFEPGRRTSGWSSGRGAGRRRQLQKLTRTAEEYASSKNSSDYSEGFQAHGRASFGKSFLNYLPREAAIDTLADEELRDNPEAYRRYQLALRQQAYAMDGHGSLSAKPIRKEDFLERLTAEEIVARGVELDSNGKFPFKMDKDDKLTMARVLGYQAAQAEYEDNLKKSEEMGTDLTAEAVRLAAEFAYTDLPNPLNAIGGGAGGRAAGGALKKIGGAAATAGAVDLATGAAGKVQAEQWGVETTWGEVGSNAMMAAGAGAGFYLVGEAAKGLVKRARRSWNDWRAGRRQAGSDEMGPGYGAPDQPAPDGPEMASRDGLDSPEGIGNNNSQIADDSPAPSVNETGPTKYSVSADEPLDRVDFVSRDDGGLELVAQSGSGASHSISLNSAQDQELLQHIGQEELAKTIQSTHGLGRGTKNELDGLKGRSRKNKVVAHCEVDGLDDLSKGYNPAANVDGHARGEQGQPLFFKRNSTRDINSDLYTADAEIRSLQSMHERFPNGELNGKNVRMSVSGKEVCRDCLQDIPAAADALGLNSIMIYEELSGSWLYWHKGMPTNVMTELGQ